MLDRLSRFAPMPGDMKLPAAHLYPSRPVPVHWSLLLEAQGNEHAWRIFAGTSIEATALATDALRAQLEAEGHHEPAIRVLMVCQVGT